METETLDKPETEEPLEEGQEPESQENAEEAKAKKVNHALEKKFQRLTAAKYQLKGELEAERRRNDELQKRLEQPSQPDAGAKPKRSDFQDEDAYIEAVAEYTANKKIETLLERGAVSRQEQEQINQTKSFQKQMREAEKNIPGFKDDVAEIMEENLPQPVLDFFLDSNKSAEIIHYLAKNPDELEDLMGMSRTRITARLGIIEDKVSKTRKQQTTEEPTPINPLKGNGTSGRSLENMSMADYAKYRMKQIQGR